MYSKLLLTYSKGLGNVSTVVGVTDFHIIEGYTICLWRDLSCPV